jgi:hypothetical protein
MAIRTESDQVVVRVVSEFAPRSKVMDLQIHRTSALLAPPSVSHQHLTVKFCISCPIQSHAPGVSGAARNVPDFESLNHVGLADLVTLKSILPRFADESRTWYSAPSKGETHEAFRIFAAPNGLLRR